MDALTPQSFEALLARALAEFEKHGTIFDLPRRSFWRRPEDLDMSVELPGGRAENPLGPAAGPHTQMAQNLVIGWLAGARVLELKTVQVRDRLEIPRPCIDAPGLGFNVEWSQELRIEESAEQYASGWYLIHILRSLGVVGPPEPGPAAVFEASLGYDLAGIRSEPVARFLDTMSDAGRLLERLRETLPPALRARADVEVPARIASSVTLSTFHGCPAEEIESIVEHLFRRHHLNVVVKLNPTLLGFETVEHLLRSRLGYREIQLDPRAFETDLKWDHALGLFERLGPLAARMGLSLGAKLTNTLVVRNHRGILPGDVMYLSGRPLHVLAVTLADRLARATGGRVPLSLSGGVDAENVSDAVACGFEPVTVCTDLLRPNGYRRLPVYLRNLEAAMRSVGASDLEGFVRARAGGGPEAGSAGEASRTPPAEAARANLSAYAAGLSSDSRYGFSTQPEPPVRGPERLELLDCQSCNRCLLVCPNDAVLALATPPGEVDAPVLALEGGEVRRLPGRFEVRRERQWGIFADLCNECGNCDTFCPESGGPQHVKPRFCLTTESFEAQGSRDAILVEDGGAKITARLSGVRYELRREGGEEVFSDGCIEVRLDEAHQVRSIRALREGEGHRLPLSPYHALRLLRDGLMARVNAVSAGCLPEGAGRR